MAAMVRKDKSKTIVHVMHVYQCAKDFFLSDFDCERSSAAAVATLLLHLNEYISWAGGQTVEKFC